VPILFGTFDSLGTSAAISAEVELSQSLQTAFANFAKNPNKSPAPHWPPYEPEVSGNPCIPTLAKIAYQGNVDFGNFVEPVEPDTTVSKRNEMTMQNSVRLLMNFSSINRMDRAMYGTLFWISAPEKLATLHKIIRVEQVEGIPQLVCKAVNQFCISSPSDSSDNHTGTDGYIHLAFLQSPVGQRCSQVQRPAGDLENYASENRKL
jgi:hypothetical protein